MWLSGIGKLIAGRYTWIITLAALIFIGATWWNGYATGKSQARVEIVEKIVEVEAKSKRASNETTKRIKTLDEVALDNELCSLGLVRGNNGCK